MKTWNSWMKQLKKVWPPIFRVTPVWLCCKVLRSSVRVWLCTGFMHSHKKCIRTKERHKVERRQGKSKLKVTTVAEGNNVVCHIGGVKREAGLCWTVLSHVCVYQNVTECDTDTSCEVNCSFHTCPVYLHVSHTQWRSLRGHSQMTLQHWTTVT